VPVIGGLDGDAGLATDPLDLVEECVQAQGLMTLLRAPGSIALHQDFHFYSLTIRREQAVAHKSRDAARAPTGSVR